MGGPRIVQKADPTPGLLSLGLPAVGGPRGGRSPAAAVMAWTPALVTHSPARASALNLNSSPCLTSEEHARAPTQHAGATA